MHFFDKPSNVRLVLRGLFVVCTVMLLIDVVDFALALHLRHSERSWEALPGFYSVYGWVGCVALVLVAKAMRVVLKRDEDFYDR